MNRRSSPTQVRTVDDLLALWDEDFVDTAFRTLLNRAPDPAGRAHFLREIRTGASKLEILRGLRDSVEGREAGAAIAGLDEALAQQRRDYRRLSKRLSRRLFGRKKLDARDRADRALRNQMAIEPDDGASQSSGASTGSADSAEDGTNHASGAGSFLAADRDALRDLRRRMARMEAVLNRMEQGLRRSKGSQGRGFAGQPNRRTSE